MQVRGVKPAVTVLAVAIAASACARKPEPVQTLVPFESMMTDARAVALSSNASNDSLESPTLGARIKDNLYILDKTSVKVADIESGAIRRAFGLPGDGDGEFRQPLSVVPVDSGRFAILDHARRVVSVRDSSGGVIKEFPIGSGFFNSVLAGPTPASFFVLGMRPTTRETPMDVHEYDLTGRRLGSYLETPSSKSKWAFRFGAAFGTRIGGELAVGSLASNEVRLFTPGTQKVRSIHVAPNWYRPPVWPANDRPDATTKIIAQQSKEWLQKQVLMNAIFPLSGGRMLVSFRDFSDQGLGSFYFAIADTAGHTFAVSRRTSIHLLDVRGDTAFWLAHDSTQRTVLGRGVIVGSTSYRVSSR